MRYFYRKGERVSGPFDIERLRGALSRGSIDLDTPVTFATGAEGPAADATWISLREALPELAGRSTASSANTASAPRSAAHVDFEVPRAAATRPGTLSVEVAMEKPPGDALLFRYTDAYGIARKSVALGDGIKSLGVTLGAAVVFAGFVASSSGFGNAALMASIVLAVGLGSSIYGIGTHIAAQGQMLLATLDTAVNTSPLMTNEQKARTMGL